MNPTPPNTPTPQPTEGRYSLQQCGSLYFILESTFPVAEIIAAASRRQQIIDALNDKRRVEKMKHNAECPLSKEPAIHINLCSCDPTPTQPNAQAGEKEQLNLPWRTVVIFQHSNTNSIIDSAGKHVDLYHADILTRIVSAVNEYDSLKAEVARLHSCGERDLKEIVQLKTERDDYRAEVGLRYEAIQKLNKTVRTLDEELATLRAELKAARETLTTPEKLHAYCLRILTPSQIAHLLGEKHVENLNRLQSELTAAQAEIVELKKQIENQGDTTE